ncbi:hypothetical protein [Schlesneria paludicola]|uniref:hypothetical protein n=1 Tax=Schlesneria paludicola TaxID=360056 RepID=UPI00029AC8F6|nr:hypothetical protein [Schlesneria paludicola]
MPVKVKCSNCEKVLSVPDTARGKAVKCPNCETRIPIPAAATSSKPAAAKAKAKKAAAPVDSEFALATFDMRRAEDTSARICAKCGFDMKYQDEEDTECPECGYDSGLGGIGAKARKKSLKGPDPADFYPRLFRDSWKFVGKNQFLALRSSIYTLVATTFTLLCLFLFLWISMWPPRLFLALCCTISFLVIPGWMWFLDTEIIKLTLEGKDKFKKLNFDFFLSSALGAASVVWCLVVMLPLILIPTMVGYVVINYLGGTPEIVFPICIAMGILPAIWMLPVAMAHMAMPVMYKGWMVWKLVPMWARTIKPLSVWLMWFLLTNTLNIAGIGVIAGVYGPDLVTIASNMEENATVARKKFALELNPVLKKKGAAPVEPEKFPDPHVINFQPIIVPCVLLLVMSLANGFTSMFNMRTNGQFVYYNRDSLELVDRKKEYKYIAKEKRDEDEDEKPKTTTQLIVDALVFFMVFDLMGLVGGMLYGSFTQAGSTKGIILGMLMGQSFANLAVYGQNIKSAFQESVGWGALTIFTYPIGYLVFIFKSFEERKGDLFKVGLSYFFSIFLFIVAYSGGVLTDDSAVPGPAGQEAVEPDAPAAKPEAPPL